MIHPCSEPATASAKYVHLGLAATLAMLATRCAPAPLPPQDRAELLTELYQPAYPNTKAADEGGIVVALCWVELDGSLTECHITSHTGDQTLSDSVLSWLTSPLGPIMQPAYQDGKPVRKLHGWVIKFPPRTLRPPAASGK
jgi:hypothetical protein